MGSSWCPGLHIFGKDFVKFMNNVNGIVVVSDFIQLEDTRKQRD